MGTMYVGVCIVVLQKYHVADHLSFHNLHEAYTRNTHVLTHTHKDCLAHLCTKTSEQTKPKTPMKLLMQCL